MRRPEFIARQSRCPSGLLGRFIGRVMAVETAEANSELLALLDLRPTDHVLKSALDTAARSNGRPRWRRKGSLPAWICRTRWSAWLLSATGS